MQTWCDSKRRLFLVFREKVSGKEGVAPAAGCPPGRFVGHAASLPTPPPTPAVPQNSLFPEQAGLSVRASWQLPEPSCRLSLCPLPGLGPLYPPRPPSLVGSPNSAPPRDVASAEVGLEQPGCEEARGGLQATPSPFLSLGRRCGEGDGSESRHVYQKDSHMKCECVLGLNSLPKVQMDISDPEGNLGGEGVGGDGVRRKRPFPSIPPWGIALPVKSSPTLA